MRRVGTNLVARRIGTRSIFSFTGASHNFDLQHTHMKLVAHGWSARGPATKREGANCRFFCPDLSDLSTSIHQH